MNYEGKILHFDNGERTSSILVLSDGGAAYGIDIHLWDETNLPMPCLALFDQEEGWKLAKTVQAPQGLIKELQRAYALAGHLSIAALLNNLKTPSAGGVITTPTSYDVFLEDAYGCKWWIAVIGPNGMERVGCVSDQLGIPLDEQGRVKCLN